jgi:integrase
MVQSAETFGQEALQFIGVGSRLDHGGGRRAHASWCINRVEDGGLELPAKVVSERLGHSNISMTLNVYAHLFPTGDDAGKLDNAASKLFA